MKKIKSFVSTVLVALLTKLIDQSHKREEVVKKFSDVYNDETCFCGLSVVEPGEIVEIKGPITQNISNDFVVQLTTAMLASNPVLISTAQRWSIGVPIGEQLDKDHGKIKDAVCACRKVAVCAINELLTIK